MSSGSRLYFFQRDQWLDYKWKLKGKFSVSNNIFSWHRSEDINKNKKKVMYKISVDSYFSLTSYA